MIIKFPIFIKKTVYTSEKFENNLRQIKATIEHEVIHYLQFKIKKSYLSGMSKKNLRNDPDAILKSNNPYGNNRGEYASTDVEYKTLLVNYKNDIVNSFKYFEKKDWGLFFKYCIHLANEKEIEYMKSKYEKLDYILAYGHVYNNMEKLKKDDFPRWKAIAKELYDDIYNR